MPGAVDENVPAQYEEQAGVGTGYQQHDVVKQELSELNQEIRDYADGVVSKSMEMLGTLVSRFKGLALPALIFNQISKAFNAMISGMKEGFENPYNEVGAFKSAVDGLKASSLTLKNSFAVAFRPLVEIAIRGLWLPGYCPDWAERRNGK